MEALYTPSFSNYRAAVQRRFHEAFFEGDLLVREHLTIEKFARGQRLGLSVLDQTIRAFSNGCSLVLIKPAPLRQTESRQERPEDRDQPRARGEHSAGGRLQAYWAQLGFERVPRSAYFALSPAERQPTAEDLQLPHAITVSAEQLKTYLASLA